MANMVDTDMRGTESLVFTDDVTGCPNTYDPTDK